MPNMNIAYSWWINTCNAPNVGYSQAYRNQQTVNGITYYDCSSFIWYGLLAAGFDCVGANNGNTWPFTTSSMGPVLQRLGFTVGPPSSFGSAKIGDIVFHPGIHTEAVYQIENNGARMITMGAHTDGVVLENQVSINGFSQSYTEYPQLARLGAGGATAVGASLYVIAALCGNAWQESTINSGLHQVGGTAFGIFQWDGGRKQALLSWLTQNGYASDDPYGQMIYFIEEPGSWIANVESLNNGISTLREFLETDITDIHLLTRLFCDCWERPGVPALENRYARADQCYQYINDHAQDGTITEWVIGNRYLTEAESLNNAVMLYRTLAFGGGGGYTEGNPPRLINKMKPWMLNRKFHILGNRR